MMILFLTSDLVFPSRASGIAQRLGATLVTATTIESLLAQWNGSSASTIALIDLNSPGVDPAAVVPRLRELNDPPKSIVAFGPHVQESKLAAARAAGCDLVLARGQFNAQMDRLIAEALSR
ncbi:MAG: hypothetical protein IT427_16485 [Pirellulales bacterium]|nr:hypothetical protein [Pirellulales bacterium]